MPPSLSTLRNGLKRKTGERAAGLGAGTSVCASFKQAGEASQSFPGCDMSNPRRMRQSRLESLDMKERFTGGNSRGAISVFPQWKPLALHPMAWTRPGRMGGMKAFGLLKLLKAADI